jgi:Haem-binding domain
MKKISLKQIGITVALLLLLSQLIRPTKNLSGDDSKSIHHKFALPADVAQTLKVACDDCHSNKTVYPWYAEVQPIAAWLQHHVDDGKRHLNFSTLGSRPAWLQYHKMEEVQEMIEKGEMPLNSYTWVHGEAKLSAAQQQAIVAWSKIVRDSLTARFPADSLKMPPRKK